MYTSPRARFLALGLLAFALSPKTHAAKTNFLESHSGVQFGAGTTFLRPNDSDPIPQLGPTGTNFSGSNKSYLMPLKFGFFKEGQRLNIEIYGRYVMNLKPEWTASGSLTGTGQSSFHSYGGGLQIGYPILAGPRFQTLVVGNAELIWQKLHVNFSDFSQLDLSSTATLMGGGLQSEIWLGDLWVLSLLAAYQYSLLGQWNVATTGTFMGVSYPAGVLHNSNGDTVNSRFGGFLFEASLKLNFQ